MSQRFFVKLKSGWSEVPYNFYMEYKGQKRKSIFDIRKR